MTPEERDALIDVTVEACAKVAANYHQQFKEPHRTFVEVIGEEIAAAIRKEFRKP
jgi:hypothetical protein